jgi:hypothetical protein
MHRLRELLFLCFPPQNAAGSNLSLSLQASIDRAQVALALAPLHASIDRAQSAMATMRAQTQEHIGRYQLEGISEGQQTILNNLRRNAQERPAYAVPEVATPALANEGIGGMVAPSHRLTRERAAARPANNSESLESSRSSASDTTSFHEPELPYWDMSTVETRAAWTQGRTETRARFRAEALAVVKGETIPPIANPSPAMLLYYNYLMARREWEQRPTTGTSIGHVNTTADADLLASSTDRTSGLVIRSVSVVADMYWCIDNLGKIRADVGDSRHSDWSDYWEAGYKKTKP